MQNTHNDVREAFSSSVIKSPTDFSDIVRRSMTTYVGEAAANRDYSRKPMNGHWTLKILLRNIHFCFRVHILSTKPNIILVVIRSS